ncbi:hypothetical protein EVAR_92672_1 [Eumeta japonica]|uniref:Uncharacterized protein n=1 Tax=Eumeta variegata TaxID=151549 RepID=A0A4C1SX22_EUMVA|nr:hypothetical protein EVAR_92672_1 [Eumeta japonica]
MTKKEQPLSFLPIPQVKILFQNTVAPNKNSSLHSQESRGQKRLSDGTPTQLQLRPIAPAGLQQRSSKGIGMLTHLMYRSQVNQDKTASRDSRATVTWTTGTARENVATSMGMKINPAHGTVIHVSSGQQTNLSMSTAGGQDGSGMYIKQIDRNSLQFQTNKDLNKQDGIAMNKIQSAQNVQMITVPPGMTVLQNPLNISQMPVLGQPNSQVYMIPTNQSNLVTTGTLPPGLISQQVLQPGQNVTVMQPNQLTLPNNMQYNTVPIMPMNVSQSTQYVPASISLSNPLAAQQLNAALATQQLANPNLSISNTIPIVQANASLSNQPQSIPITQPPPTITGTGNLLPSNLNHIVPQNSYITPTTQYQTLPTQYVMQPNSSTMTIQPTATSMQYNIQSNSTNNPQNNLGNSTPSNSTSDSDVSSTPTDTNSNNQNNYLAVPPQQPAYPLNGGQNVQNSSQQNYPSDSSPPAQNISQSTAFPSSTSANVQGYGTPNAQSSQNLTYNAAMTANQAPATQTGTYTTNTTNQSTTPGGYGASANQNPQSVPQASYSPSTTPAANQQSYPANNLVNLQNANVQQTMPMNQHHTNSNSQNPYPNATGQNMAAYASGQYQYNGRPWYRPRFGSPQTSPYNSTNVPPPNAASLSVPPPSANYNYWQES